MGRCGGGLGTGNCRGTKCSTGKWLTMNLDSRRHFYASPSWHHEIWWYMFSKRMSNLRPPAGAAEADG